jgi:hypothetical protein
MMLLAPLLLLAAPTFQEAPSASDVAERFRAAHEALDEDACRQLWSERPERALATIAGDVDLALNRTATGDGYGPEATKLLARALWGARRAEEAIGASLLPEQVAAVLSWGEQDRRNHEAEQRIYERGLQSLANGDDSFALEAGVETVLRAAALGDWWTTAHAHVLVGDVHQSQSAFDDALVAFSRARLMFEGLGALDDEYHTLVRMTVVCNALEADSRGLEASRRALYLHRRLAALGHSVPDEDHALHLRVRMALQKRIGDAEGAAATKAELDALGKR